MRMVVIDGAKMPTKAAAHKYLAERLTLPEYYGKNLDALYDVLTAETEIPTCLIIYRREALEESLGRYGAALLDTIWDAAQENPNLQAVFDGDEGF